jgi:DNA-3-methyladenine glycosylase II
MVKPAEVPEGMPYCVCLALARTPLSRRKGRLPRETTPGVLPPTPRKGDAFGAHAPQQCGRIRGVPAKEVAPIDELQTGWGDPATAIGSMSPALGQGHTSVTFLLRPVAPFRLDFTVWALRRRPRNLIDRWDGTTYRRVIVLGGRPTELAVRQAGSCEAPRLIVTATPRSRTLVERRMVRGVVERLLGLRIDLADWYHTATGDARLRPLAERFRGMKPPRFPTMFEAVVNAFACQQLSLEVGVELLNRLATISGARLRTPPDRYGFPRVHDVTQLTPEKCRAIGFSHQKARALLGLATAITRRELDLESIAAEGDAEVRRRLLELRGVGRWTAEYVMLRGLGRLHVFPGDDVGAQKRLARWLGRSRPLDYAGVGRVVERWKPFAGLVYFHLLLDGLFRAGILDAVPKTPVEAAGLKP